MAEMNANGVREELAGVLASAIPEEQEKLEAIDWLLQADPRAPYQLALHSLTGAEISEEAAAGAWKSALEMRHEWSQKLRQPITMRAAATEAVVRRMESGDAESAVAQADSLQSYLQRDMATGLYSRDYFEKRLADEVDAVTRTGQPVSLLLLELEGMDRVAQNGGLEAVEETLRSTAQMARYHFRHADVACRYEMNSFAVIMPATLPGAAELMGMEFINQLRQFNGETPIRASGGAASCPLNATDSKLLEKAAAVALRQAKESPGSLVVSSQKARSKAHGASAEKRLDRRFKTGLALGLGVGLLAEAGVVALTLNHRDHSALAAAYSRPSIAMAKSSPLNAPFQPMNIANSPAKDTASPIEIAARPRLVGNYVLASDQLAHLASTTKDPFIRSKAWIASAAASAAGGQDSLGRLRNAREAALLAPPSIQSWLNQLISLTRGEWYASRHLNDLALGSFTEALQGPRGPEYNDAVLGLFQSDRAANKKKEAVDLAEREAAAVNEPAVRAAYRILAADARGSVSEILQLAMVQPAALNVPERMGKAVTRIVAAAIVPTGGASRADWSRNLKMILGAPGLPTTTRAGLRLTVAHRLLQIGDPQEAHWTLQTLLGESGESGPKSPRLTTLEAQQALVDDGLALSKLKDMAGAHKEWKLAISKAEDRTLNSGAMGDHQPQPSFWSPVPEEQWWVQSARLLESGKVPPAG